MFKMAMTPCIEYKYNLFRHIINLNSQQDSNKNEVYQEIHKNHHQYKNNNTRTPYAEIEATNQERKKRLAPY